MAEPNPYRLPTSVVPRRYELELAPDLAAATFAGQVAVEADVVEPTREVVLNAVELEVDEAWVQVGPVRHEAAVALDAETERATLTVAEVLEPGPVVVGLRFRGVLNDKLRGFYRSTFTDPDGVERTIATTQFEATDARRAFPCWDEPEAKAVFAVSLVVEGDLTVVSNAGVAADEPVGEGRRRVRFADTMPMSTYLVAFVVGPLEVAGPVDVDGTPLRILCPPGKSHLTPFALEVAAFSLRYLADYFDIAYPGDTLDLVAIPDFAFGAMENLGCVTFRETLLLVDPDKATQSELQRVVDVIAHELAHMWFGDLVTMKWWNGIWLNEAFATFMELKVTDAFRPEWERWVGFGLSRSTAFDTDALHSTRPVEYPVVSPRDAEGMFDVLTYEKGAAVVRMLEQYLGEEPFRAGIRRYMDTHRYGNTETTDLWDAIEAATGEPVRRIMDSWIFQGGFPEVTVERRAGGLALAQRAFTYLDGEASGAEWAIPLVLRVGGEGPPATTTTLLDEATAELDLPAEPAWVVGNVEGNGFYRVRYGDELRRALVERAQQELSALERYGLVDDTWASVLAGTTPARAVVELAEGMADEEDLAVWSRLVGALSSLHRVVADAGRPALSARLRGILRPPLDRLGWQPVANDDDRRRELRGVLLGALAIVGDDPEARAWARRIFADLRAGAAVDATLGAAAVRVVAATAGPADLDELLAGFRGASTPQEEQRYLYSLADVDDPAQFDRVLALAVSDEVRTQNAPFLVGACVANRRNGAAAWALISQRWEEMNQRFPANSIVWLLNGIRAVADAGLAARIEAFLDEHPVPQAAKVVAQHRERMRVTVALAEREATRLA
ncbi:MAG: M1 family metallopeptidase [Acidimicrobiia bacterium]